MLLRFFLSALFLGCQLPLLISHAIADDGRPNIVFLFADDQCCYSMGCYGNPDVQTPNLDRLASVGLAFENQYDTTAICMASRATVMTGRYEYKTGCNFDHGPLTSDLWSQSYPVLLREAGYRTAFAGKFGFEVVAQPGERKGWLPSEDFHVWGGGPGQTSYATAKNKSMKKYASEYPHSTLSYGAFAQDFVRDSANSDQPFCLSISFKALTVRRRPIPSLTRFIKARAFTSR